MRFVVNIKTPDTMETIKKLIDHVESNEVTVSKAYRTLKEFHEWGRVLQRPGYDFKFWFTDKAAATQFAADWNGEIFVELPVSKEL
jgi:hypothetical protein